MKFRLINTNTGKPNTTMVNDYEDIIDIREHDRGDVEDTNAAFARDGVALRYAQYTLRDEAKDQLDEHFFKCLREYPLPPYRVYTFSRDCDMVESTETHTVMSYISLVKDYLGWKDGLEWAEGPQSWELVDPATCQDGRSSRDRIMEAYENGQGRNIYV